MDNLVTGMEVLWDDVRGLYSDNTDTRQLIYPQDGNSWALVAEGIVNATRAKRISTELKARWGKYGAPAVEIANVISPFATSFELLAHCEAQEYQTALDLMRLQWGYMLDGPGFTNSTLIEGYAVDGDIHYPAFSSSAYTSHAHGWSTGPTFVLSTRILGIQLLAPLGKVWRIEPHFADLDSAEGGYATSLGKFVVKWTKGGNLIVITPEASQGTIVWNGMSRKVSGGGGFVWMSDGLKRLDTHEQVQYDEQIHNDIKFKEGGQRPLGSERQYDEQIQNDIKVGDEGQRPLGIEKRRRKYLKAGGRDGV